MRQTQRPPLFSGLIYHIFNQGNNRENIYKEERNYEYFLRKYREFISPITDTYAYCLLPNHFHILVQFKNYELLHEAKPRYFPAPPKGMKNKNSVLNMEQLNYDKIVSDKLSRQFANFFGGYTRAINNAFDRKGKLFTQPFERVIVDNEAYFEWLICYIHRNPIHHNFCDDFGVWQHSSYLEISNYLKMVGTSGVSTPSANTTETYLCDLEFLSDWFKNYENFQNLHEKATDALLDRKYLLE